MRNFYTKLVLGVIAVCLWFAWLAYASKTNAYDYRSRVHRAAEDWVRQASIARIQDPTLHIWCEDDMCQVFYRPPMEHDVSRITLRCGVRVCVEMK